MRSPLEFFILRFHPQTLQCEGLRSDSGICIFNELPKLSSWAPGLGNPGAIAFFYRCVESCAFLLNHRTRPQLLQVAEGPFLRWPWPSSFNSFSTFHCNIRKQFTVPLGLCCLFTLERWRFLERLNILLFLDVEPTPLPQFCFLPHNSIIHVLLNIHTQFPMSMSYSINKYKLLTHKYLLDWTKTVSSEYK